MIVLKYHMNMNTFKSFNFSCQKQAINASSDNKGEVITLIRHLFEDQNLILMHKL